MKTPKQFIAMPRKPLSKLLYMCNWKDKMDFKESAPQGHKCAAQTSRNIGERLHPIC